MAGEWSEADVNPWLRAAGLVHDQAFRSGLNPERDETRKRMTAWLLRILESPRKVSAEIIIPRGQLYIEALTGALPLLDEFKLQHRKIDVENTRGEAVQAQLKAIRYVARITTGELTDPEVQTQIVGTTAGLEVNVASGGTGPNP